MMAALQAQNIYVAFNGKGILTDLSFFIDKGKITSIIGPNGSGKSTLLKTLSKNLVPARGTVYLSGKDLRTVNVKELAKRMAVLFQSSTAPSDVTVRDLVEYGRYPHQNWWQGRSEADNDIVSWAMRQTGVEELADRPVVTLSGGEQQRAWIAMALAQQPSVLLLDEPTTYLDIAHQLEIMELLKRLNRENALSVVMVLHDLNHAAKYSDYIVALHRGKIVAAGSPAEVVTTDMLRAVFAVEVDLWHDQEQRPVFVARGLVTKDASYQ
ncbi:MAG: ABC transporter ATP-binding protein [Negativicutes bacterium]|nr:ABC transporter ATP-binding protein [Negativicutes bacterium]